MRRVYVMITKEGDDPTTCNWYWQFDHNKVTRKSYMGFSKKAGAERNARLWCSKNGFYPEFDRDIFYNID